MARYNYERLSAQDNSFLLFETPKTHMHVSATQIYEAGPLATPDGGVDFEAIKHGIACLLHRIPRYRQRLHFIPFANHGVWVDDRHFEIDYHMRHTSLPRPGTDEQLKALSARVMAQQLDRARPLWEMWVVEGLEGGRFAVITKIHHCMIDGSSGVDLAHIQLSPTPDATLPEPQRFIPRPAPSRATLWRDEVIRRGTLPLQAFRGFQAFAAETDDLRNDVAIRLRAVGNMLGWAVRSPSKTPLNGPLGPHRLFDWHQTPLAHVKAVRKALDCSVNDVVLTVVTGAVREFMIQRQVRPEEIDFRIAAPVSVRSETEKGELGNRVSSWIVPLPIGLADPLEQLGQLHQVTQELKDSQEALGVEMMMKAAEWTPASLMSLGAQAASGPINSIVTNVPGPQFPLYMQGAKLVAMYPQVPLLQNIGLGIALMSYDGQVFWGFNADYNLVPDVADFASLIAASFAKLAETAGVNLAALDSPAADVIEMRLGAKPKPA
jgi:WS/DGAT/MGAT family acyltransferase